MINYKIIARANPLDRNAPLKYYPTAVKGKIIDEEYLENEISSMSSLNPADCSAMITILMNLVIKHLVFGNYIKLSRLGTFSVTSTSTGELDPADVTASNIKRLNLRFKPSAKIKHALKEARFEKVVS